MKKSLFLLCLLLGMLGNCALVLAQPAQKLINVVVSPDRIDWKCKAKEEVKFTVQVFKNENLLKDVVVDYELGPEYFPTVVKKDIRLADGKTTLKAKMNEPGFIHLRFQCRFSICQTNVFLYNRRKIFRPQFIVDNYIFQ